MTGQDSTFDWCGCRRTSNIHAVALLGIWVLMSFRQSAEVVAAEARRPLLQIFLRAWQPEMEWSDRGQSVVLTPAERRLMTVAPLTKAGNLKAARAVLNSYLGISNAALNGGVESPSLHFLAWLCAWQLSDQEYRYVSGDDAHYNAQGEIPDVASAQAQSALLHQLKRLASTLPDDQGGDDGEAMTAASICALLERGPICLSTMRQMAFNDAFPTSPQPLNQGADQADAQLDKNMRHSLSKLVTNYSDAVRQGLLDPEQGHIATLWWESAFLAIGDRAAAKARLRQAADIAEEHGWRRARATTLLQLGDLYASPWGPVESEGWCIALLPLLRLRLSFPTGSVARIFPKPSDLALANDYYHQSQAALGDIATAADTCRFEFRNAYLAQRQGDGSAASAAFSRAETAAQEGERNGTLSGKRPAALAQFGRALVMSSSTMLQSAMNDLAAQQDIGGVLSLEEMAMGSALGLQGATPAILDTIELLRTAVNGLQQHGLGLATNDIWFVLATLRNGLGQTELALDTLQQGLGIARQHDQLRSAQVRTLPGNLLPPGITTGQYGSTIHEIDLSMRFQAAASLLYTLQGKVEEEGRDNWAQQRDDLEHEAVMLARESHQEVLLRGYLDAKQRYDQLAPFLTASSKDEIIAAYPAARSAMQQAHMTSIMWQLDAKVASYEPSVLDRSRAELHRDTVDGMDRWHYSFQLMRQHLPDVGGPADGPYQAAVQSVVTYFAVALQLRDYERLATWAREYMDAAKLEPRLRFLVPTARLYLAAAQVKTGHVREGRAMLMDLSNDPVMINDVQLRLAVNNWLIYCDAELGDNVEGSLLCLERIHYENEQIQLLRSGLDVRDIDTAEYDTLIRDRVLGGRLKADQESRLRELEARLHRNRAYTTPPPGQEQIINLLGHLPKRVTVLVYHVAPQGVFLWTLADGRVPMLRRLPIDSEILNQAIYEWRGRIVDMLPAQDLEQSSRALYEMIIKPSGTLPAHETIAIIRPREMEGVAFEQLGPTAGQTLDQTHTVVYCGRLFTQAATTPAAQSRTTLETNGTAVIVSGTSPNLHNPTGEASMIAAKLSTKVKVVALLQGGSSQSVAAEVPKARWLHISAHGKLDTSNPFRSYLLLSDGPLEAWKLFSSALTADLIVLSACDSGRSVAGRATIAGLAGDTSSLASFAGATSARWVVASLWEADADKTPKLMADFYDELGLQATGHYSVRPDEALRQAQLKMRATNAPPFAYANFVATIRDLSVLSDE